MSIFIFFLFEVLLTYNTFLNFFINGLIRKLPKFKITLKYEIVIVVLSLTLYKYYINFFLVYKSAYLHIEFILTITGWEWMTPPVVFFTQKRLFMAQPVSRITTKGNSRTYGEIVTVATTVYRNARVQARISVHCNT